MSVGEVLVPAASQLAASTTHLDNGLLEKKNQINPMVVHGDPKGTSALADNPFLGGGVGAEEEEDAETASRRWEMQLKGAGQTPFCRGADGRAVLRSSIREFLVTSCGNRVAAFALYGCCSAFMFDCRRRQFAFVCYFHHQ